MRNLLSLVATLAVVFTLNVSNAFAANCGNSKDVGNASCNGNDTVNVDDDYNDNSTNNEGGAGGAGGDAAQAQGQDQDQAQGQLQGQLQGQQQGQIGINEQGQSQFGINANETKVNTTDTNVNGQSQSSTVKTDVNTTDVNTNVSSTSSSAKTDVDTKDTNVVGQSQSGFNAQKNGDFSGDIFTVEGDTTLVEAPKIPVNSAAASMGGACNSGVAFTNDNASFSAGSGNPVCDLLAVARGYAAIGDLEATRGVLAQAEKAARFRALFGYVRTALTLGLL